MAVMISGEGDRQRKIEYIGTEESTAGVRCKCRLLTDQWRVWCSDNFWRIMTQWAGLVLMKYGGDGGSRNWFGRCGGVICWHAVRAVEVGVLESQWTLVSLAVARIIKISTSRSRHDWR